jgi:hypothetical protein
MFVNRLPATRDEQLPTSHHIEFGDIVVDTGAPLASINVDLTRLIKDISEARVATTLLADSKVYTLAEMTSLLASASDADIEATLASINVNVRAKLIEALGGEATFETTPLAEAKEYTLEEAVSLLASASDVETAAALDSLSRRFGGEVNVVTKPLDDTMEYTLEEMVALFASASDADAEAMSMSMSMARAKLVEAIGGDANVATKPLADGKEYTLEEMAALLASASDADTKAAFVRIGVDVRRKLIEAIGGGVRIATKPLGDARVRHLAETIALLASASDADIEVALASISVDLRAKLIKALGDEASIVMKSLADGHVYVRAETEAVLAKMNKGCEAKAATNQATVKILPFAPYFKSNMKQLQKDAFIEIYSMFPSYSNMSAWETSPAT